MASGEEFRNMIDFLISTSQFCFSTCKSESYVFKMFTQIKMLCSVLLMSQKKMSNLVPLPHLCFESLSYPVASIVFGDMAIVSLYLLFFLGNPRSCVERYRLAQENGVFLHLKNNSGN